MFSKSSRISWARLRRKTPSSVRVIRRCPVEELLAQLPFQVHHLLGQGGLGEEQGLGGPGDALFPGDGQEVVKQPGLDHGKGLLWMGSPVVYRKIPCL